MADKRHKNWQWQVGNDDGQIHGWEGAHLAVLMDIRDELQQLNRLLGCSNFIAVPSILREIRETARETATNTKKKRKRRVPVTVATHANSRRVN